jgi:hypothetical protein
MHEYAQLLDILLRHLISDVIGLTNRQCDNRKCRIFRRAGCKLTAIRKKSFLMS